MISRRTAIGAMTGAASLYGKKGRKPNFLFLLADDHAGYVLGAHGNQKAQTPNLDRLASEGTRFANHFCNSPVCTPSRQSFFTGQLPHSAGVTVLKTPLDENKPTLAKRLREAGYDTAVFGKMHFNRPAKDGVHGFNTMRTEDWIQKNWNGQPFQHAPADLRTKPQWRPFRDPARIWLNAEKLPYPRYYDEMRGTFTARRAVEFLRQHKDDPFAMWASFPDPHSPYDFSIDDREKFDPKTFEVPRVGPEDNWQIPLIFRDLSHEEKQGIAAAYYTSVWQLDRNIGEILTALRELNLEDDTYVVYMADHGYCLGQHGRFEKHCGYDPAMHVPLIMRFPGRIRKGATVNDLTEHVDVSATIMDMLGVDALPVTHGQSLRPYLEGKQNHKARTHVFSEYLENEEAFVRTNRWKLIQSTGNRKRTDGYETDKPTPGRYLRLYDLKNDPGEFTDVAAKNKNVVDEMQRLMLDRFRKTHPDAPSEPKLPDATQSIEFYLKPRDA